MLHSFQQLTTRVTLDGHRPSEGLALLVCSGVWVVVLSVV